MFTLYHQYFYFSGFIYINYIMPVRRKQSLQSYWAPITLPHSIAPNTLTYKNENILRFRNSLKLDDGTTSFVTLTQNVGHFSSSILWEAFQNHIHETNTMTAM
jgi:hypothetical protein